MISFVILFIISQDYIYLNNIKYFTLLYFHLCLNVVFNLNITFQSQYRFVCEAVHKAYSEGIAKPLPEFSR